MANTRNSGTRSGERQRRQQQPGTQQAPRGADDGERRNAQTEGQGGETHAGQSTRNQSNERAASGWNDEESLRSNRRHEADEAMRAREAAGGDEETGEDEDMPSRTERRAPSEERSSQR